MKFTTLDKDQDTWSGNCARKFLGAFWYSNCHSTNPNGVYRWGSDGTLYAVGVSWYGWKGHDYSLKAISMKIRPVQCCQQNQTCTVPACHKSDPEPLTDQ